MTVCNRVLVVAWAVARREHAYGRFRACGKAHRVGEGRGVEEARGQDHGEVLHSDGRGVSVYVAVVRVCPEMRRLDPSEWQGTTAHLYTRSH